MKIETISIDKLVVSPLNIRANEEFGLTRGGEFIPEDEALIKNVKREDVKQLITVRPNLDNYEVVLGRRRFLALKENGVKEVQCVVRDLDDREALKASLIENLRIFQKSLDPVTRAKALKHLMSITPKGMVAIARELGVPKSTLSEWLRVLDLGPKMQEQVSLGTIAFRDALRVARLELDQELQDSLARTITSKGIEAFRSEVERIGARRGKRGAPPGLLVVRLVFDPRSKREKSYYEALVRLSKVKKMEISKYCRSILVEHAKDPESEWTVA